MPTRATARELDAVGFHNLTTVGRGVDTERFSPARRSADLRRQWQAGSSPVLLMVGRVAAEKNVELGLRAFELVYPAAGSLNSSVEVEPERLAALVGSGWVDVCRGPD